MGANWNAASGVVIAGLALLVSGLALLRAHFKGAQGEATELGALENRVEALEKRADTVDQVIAGLTSKVELLPAMNEKLNGLDRLVNSRLDHLDGTLGRMVEKLDRMSESRSFNPPG